MSTMRSKTGIVGAFLAAAAIAAPAGFVACKGSGGLTAGEECHSSSECGAGLVCDFGQTPPVCASELTQGPPDAAPAIDGEPGPDAVPGTPDAPPAPDAPPGTPDAAPVPDAAVPDAALPDAAVPDAALPDA